MGKWTLWLLAGLLAIACLVWAGLWLREYLNERPHQAKRYAGLNLGDQHKEVLYALGPPKHYLMPPAPALAGKSPLPFGAADKMVWDVAQGAEHKETFQESAEWLYAEDGGKRLDVAFDKAGGQVVSIACFSEGFYRCPALYGIRDGTTEEQVLSHLGKPAATEIDGVAKIVRYPQFNLTLYMSKRQVYMLKLSEGAAR